MSLLQGTIFAVIHPTTRFMESLDRTIGMDRLKLFHMNDSRTPQGSRVDRHEHIGEGYIGGKALGRFLRDSRFAGHAFILETPKGEDGDGLDWDIENLRRLRRLSQPNRHGRTLSRGRSGG